MKPPGAAYFLLRHLDQVHPAGDHRDPVVAVPLGLHLPGVAGAGDRHRLLLLALVVERLLDDVQLEVGSRSLRVTAVHGEMDDVALGGQRHDLVFSPEVVGHLLNVGEPGVAVQVEIGIHLRDSSLIV